jgi:hypothetical protein
LHHNVAFDGADAPSPRLAALFQNCFKDLKLLRRHSKNQSVPLHHLSGSCLEGSTLSAGYTRKFMSGPPSGHLLATCNANIDNLKGLHGIKYNHKTI